MGDAVLIVMCVLAYTSLDTGVSGVAMMVICVLTYTRGFKGTGMRLALARTRVTWYRFEMLLYAISAYYQC